MLIFLWFTGRWASSWGCGKNWLCYRPSDSNNVHEVNPLFNEPSNKLQQRPRKLCTVWSQPFLTEPDGNRDNRCCSLLIHYKRDVLLCPAERNISVILNLCLTAQAMRFAERSWILSFSLGLLLRIHPLWWKYPHDP